MSLGLEYRFSLLPYDDKILLLVTPITPSIDQSTIWAPSMHCSWCFFIYSPVYLS